MTIYRDFSITASANTGEASAGLFKENMAYSSVNDGLREFQAILARDRADKNGTLIAGGSSSSYVLSVASTISSYRDGDYYRFQAHMKNVGATTLQVSTLSARPVVKTDLSPLIEGDIIAGGVYEAYYRSASANFQILNPSLWSYPAGDVRRYGAVAGGTASVNVAAIQAAFNAASLVIIAEDYDIDGTLTLNGGSTSLRFEGAGKLTYTGLLTKPALVIGGDSTGTYRQTFDGLYIVNEQANDNSNESFVGVRFINFGRNYVRIARVEGFTVNVQLWGSSTNGIAYNTFMLGDIQSAKYHIDINSRVESAFINENIFIGGRIGNTSGYDGDTDSYGVTFRAESGAYTSNNNNVFIKPAFELIDGNSGADRIPILIDNAGLYNTFENIRAETGRGPILKVTAATAGYGNEVSVGFWSGSYLTIDPVETGAGAYGNTVINSTLPYSSNPLVWHSGDLTARAFGVTATEITVPGCFMAASGGAGATTYSAAGAIFRDCVSISNAVAIGVFVDTTEIKNLLVQTNTLRARTGRVGVICYNAAGTILTSSDANHPYAVGTGIAGGATFGYAYKVGADGVNRTAIRLHADVTKVAVLITGGTAPVDLRSFTITGFSPTADMSALHLYADLSQEGDQIYAAADPDSARNGGRAARGKMVWNNAAASGQPIGWICTTAGTNAKAWADTAAYVVGQMVSNDTDKTYVCVTAGTSAGSGGPTGTGAAIADNDVVWNYEGPLSVFGAGPSAA